MSQLTAVKAVIYDSSGKILLQKRDNIPEILDPNLWGFFGGMVEEGETFKTALAREMMEELGCKVGPIEDELFRTDHGTYGIFNVAFLVPCTCPIEDFLLGEGQAFGWFAINELIALPLSPLVSRHISLLMRVITRIDSSIGAKLENALLKYCKLLKKNDRVFYAQGAPVALGMQSLMFLKELAFFKDLSVFRVCLHKTDDEPIHEMLIIHTCSQTIGPLKQNKTSLSYHMLDGSAKVRLHNESGDSIWEGCLDSLDNFSTSFIRLDAKVFRSMQTLSPYAIFLEVASGPFEDNDTVWLNLEMEV